MALELLKYLSNVFTGTTDAGDDPFASYWQYLADEQYRKNPAAQPPGAVIINGIILPQTVIEQLRQHGFNPEWCSRYELEAARQEAVIDNTVFDDPEGNNFFDDLELTEEEREEDNNETEPPPYRMHLHVRPDAEHAPHHGTNLPPLSFCEMEKKRRRENGSHGGDDANPGMDSFGGM